MPLILIVVYVVLIIDWIIGISHPSTLRLLGVNRNNIDDITFIKALIFKEHSILFDHHNSHDTFYVTTLYRFPCTTEGSFVIEKRFFSVNIQ